MSYPRLWRGLLIRRVCLMVAIAILTGPARAADYQLEVRDGAAVVSQDGRLVLQVALEPESVTTDDPNGPEPLPVVDRAFLLLDRLVVVRRELRPNYCTGPSAKLIEIYPLGGGEKESVRDYPAVRYMLGARFKSPDEKWVVILNEAENFLEGYAVFIRGGGHTFVEVKGTPFLGASPEARFVSSSLFELSSPASRGDAGTSVPGSRMLLSIRPDATFTLEEY